MTLPHPVAWRYCPSETFSENILTEDRVKAMSARHDFGHTVEGLYTEDQLKAAVLEERERWRLALVAKADAVAEANTSRRGLNSDAAWVRDVLQEMADELGAGAAIRSRGE